MVNIITVLYAICDIRPDYPCIHFVSLNEKDCNIICNGWNKGLSTPIYLVKSLSESIAFYHGKRFLKEDIKLSLLDKVKLTRNKILVWFK